MVPNDSANNPLCHSAIGSMVTFDYQPPDTRNVITSWNENLLNVDHLTHGNWVVYFKT